MELVEELSLNGSGIDELVPMPSAQTHVSPDGLTVFHELGTEDSGDYDEDRLCPFLPVTHGLPPIGRKVSRALQCVPRVVGFGVQSMVEAVIRLAERGRCDQQQKRKPYQPASAIRSHFADLLMSFVWE